MKAKKIKGKLLLNKKTIVHLDNTRLNRVKGGTVFTEPGFFTCYLPDCVTQLDTCGTTCPNPSGEPYCQLCDLSDPISGCGQ